MPIEKLHNESTLVRNMQEGSEDAFTALYHYYSPKLYLNILGMVKDPVVAEDLVQELFTKIWQKRECVGIAENFTGYLYRIGQNLIFDFFRKVQRDRNLLNKICMLVNEQAEFLVEDKLQLQESSIQLKKAIDQLPPQQKKVFELVKIEGYTYKKAAGLMGISPLTVKEYLVAANKSIRNYLSKYGAGAFALLWIDSFFAGLS